MVYSPASPSLDLSRLPAPAVLAPLDFESLRQDWLDDFRARWPEFDALVESDPAIKLIETGAYRELIVRAQVNDAARALLLAFATGSDLDHIAALFGVTRLVITPATDTTPAVLESDADLRRRVQLQPERWAGPGLTVSSYSAIALAVAPVLRDVGIIKRGGGRVDVILLGRDGDGSVGDDIVDAVRAAIDAEDGAQLTDIVTVRSATILAYAPTLTLTLGPGPDPVKVAAAAEAAVRAFADARRRVALPVYASMLQAAAAVGGVERVDIDITDVVPAADQAGWLQSLTIAIAVLA